MAPPASRWRHRDFMLLWIGQSVSQVGNQFTGLALPFIAVLTLDATAGEMGLLGAMGTMPIGSVVGGVLASVLEVRTAILLMVVVGLGSFLWVFFSPVRRLRTVPEPIA